MVELNWNDVLAEWFEYLGECSGYDRNEDGTFRYIDISHGWVSENLDFDKFVKEYMVKYNENT